MVKKETINVKGTEITVIIYNPNFNCMESHTVKNGINLSNSRSLRIELTNVLVGGE